MAVIGETLLEDNKSILAIEIRVSSNHNTCIVKIWLNHNNKVSKLTYPVANKNASS